MTPALSEQKKHQLIKHEVDKMLARSASWRAMPGPQRDEILANTTAVVQAMAAGPVARRSADPYAPLSVGLDAPPPLPPPPPFPGSSGSSTPTSGSSSSSTGDGAMGSVINAGVDAAARMVNEIDFPSFVSSLIEGTFHAIVKSSIEQMTAYADLVKSVSQSLNDFRDQNVTENQGKDQLVSKYPSIFQMNVVNGAPQVQARPDADTSSLPDFQKDFGLNESITDLDDETIAEKLVPAARDDVAKNRQQLLATVILMGINRIIVTDGKINAKIRFQFTANEKTTRTAQSFDYQNMGDITTSTGNSQFQRQGAQTTPDGGFSGTSIYATNQYQTTSQPDVRVTSQVDTKTDGAIQAAGQIMGEVSVNFRSETFPLEKMVDTNQMFQLQQAQRGPGRGVPAAPAPGAAPASGPGALLTAPTAPTTAPAPAPTTP